MEKKGNLWVIPTNKPSKLYLGDNGNFVFGLIQSSIKSKNNDFTNQNIYITSDEEIKEGDWVIYNNKLQKSDGISFKSVDKKIILTTDQDLIKDGVQAIDDEFLQWFVKNPSCESVEIIEQYRKCCRNTDGKNENCIEPINCEGWLSNEYEQPYKTTCEKRFEGYEIVIPKEEQKQDWYCPKCDSYVSAESVTFEETHQICNTSVIDKEEPKQETLEEVAVKWIRQPNLITEKESFIAGAKWQQEQEKITTDDAYNEGFENGKRWQQERGYSEEEVEDLLLKVGNILESSSRVSSYTEKKIKEWFEQFKKK